MVKKGVDFPLQISLLAKQIYLDQNGLLLLLLASMLTLKLKKSPFQQQYLTYRLNVEQLNNPANSAVKLNYFIRKF